MNSEYISDLYCTEDTPIKLGIPCLPIYGAGQAIYPRIPGKHESKYDYKTFLPKLFPLEQYDRIIILFSGGKDSTAAYCHLRELGAPKEKIELWHHSLDGGHPTRKMDWPCTQNYVRAFAQAEGVSLRISQRVNGYWGEVYRLGASYPIEYENRDGSFCTCPCSTKQRESARLREHILSKINPQEYAQLKKYGYRMKFPAKVGDLNRRWCSAYLKIDVALAVIRNLCKLEQFKTTTTWQDIRLLIVSGERRGESSGRAKYNEIETHRTNAIARTHRLVHQWRAVIDYSERDIWEVLKRHRITPHPCYSCGWNRCSCMLCIFSLPKHWAGIRELFPAEYEAVCQDEIRLGFTLNKDKTLDQYVGDARSCVYHGNRKALYQLTTGKFTPNDIYTPANEWIYPAGAFHGSIGGPC